MVSVVIPTHNRADLLPRAIKSVQAQTVADLEILVVSDGSTDNTKEIVEALAKTDSRIRLIENFPAQGGNVARNTGIEAAKGEYVAFLDDDDEWMPEKLEKQLQIMQQDPSVGLVYTGVRIIYVNENVTYNSKARDQGDLSQRILLDNCIGTTSTVMVKRDLTIDVGMFDIALKALQDYDLWIRVCQKCNIGVVPEEQICYYNYTGTKQVSAVTQKYIESFEYINAKYQPLFATLSNEQQKTKKCNEYILLINKAMRNKEGRLARKYVKNLLRVSFSKKAILLYLLSFFKYEVALRLRSKF